MNEDVLSDSCHGGNGADGGGVLSAPVGGVSVFLFVFAFAFLFPSLGGKQMYPEAGPGSQVDLH